MRPTKEWTLLLVWMASAGGWAQSRQVVCDRGSGHFDSTLAGVTVHVGSVKSRGFGTRACEAVLRWGTGGAVVVPTAEQVDIDVIGADLGMGEPVIAFVVRPAQDNWRQYYEVWSMGRKPRKLLTLTGADMYRAADAEFNGQVAIWTTDASGVEDFDGLKHSDFTSPPMMALRLERGGLLDVSAWYRSKYDRQIAALRHGLTAQELEEFQSSDGRLIDGMAPAEVEARLRRTKTMVLEIVWAYLYSGRPERAWAQLEAAWPSGDVARAKAAILEARSRGIEAQVEKVASATQPSKWNEEPPVYEFLKADPTQQNGGQMVYGALGVSGPGPVFVRDQEPTGLYAADKEPKAISLWRPPPPVGEQAFQQAEDTLLLTIDQAGKVQSAKMMAPRSDAELLRAALDWKFIPAYSDGKPVAYRLKMDVQLIR
ncbi:energy transducer TonB [Granulicella sp. L46]|uniref:energy transducer TonB n=1 Tax=Granulicella sp. L46 TaxID=1641865 RepID=UPI00131C9A0A|nr:hypothetical protein [Granulicella sp. L46]